MVVECVGEGVLVGGAGRGPGISLANGKERQWSPSVWRYRTKSEFTASLKEAGFTVENLYGDWTRGPLTTSSPDIVVVAIKQA